MTSTVIRSAQPTKTSQHIGAIGDRILVKGVMRKVIGGRPCLNIIHDGDGNEIVCRSHKPLGSERALMHFECTVEAHQDYKGVKRTEVKGVTLYKWED